MLYVIRDSSARRLYHARACPPPEAANHDGVHAEIAGHSAPAHPLRPRSRHRSRTRPGLDHRPYDSHTDVPRSPFQPSRRRHAEQPPGLLRDRASATSGRVPASTTRPAFQPGAGRPSWGTRPPRLRPLPSLSPPQGRGCSEEDAQRAEAAPHHPRSSRTVPTARYPAAGSVRATRSASRRRGPRVFTPTARWSRSWRPHRGLVSRERSSTAFSQPSIRRLVAPQPPSRALSGADRKPAGLVTLNGPLLLR